MSGSRFKSMENDLGPKTRLSELLNRDFFSKNKNIPTSGMNFCMFPT
jgi:hypothetical protein